MQTLLRVREAATVRRSIVLAALLAVASGGIWVARHSTCRRAPVAPLQEKVDLDQTVHCIEGIAPPALALEHISLERRWLVGSFASPAEVDAALGTQLKAWDTFTYVFDSQPRQAVASPIYPTYERRAYEFGKDEYGNLWLTNQTSLVPAKRPAGEIRYTRDIYLLPVGTSFLGVHY
jgi:hypothetical protein